MALLYNGRADRRQREQAADRESSDSRLATALSVAVSLATADDVELAAEQVQYVTGVDTRAVLHKMARLA